MKHLYFLLVVLALSSCSVKTTNFNVLEAERTPDIITEYLVLDTVSLLKKLKPPAISNIIIEINDDEGKYLSLLINRLRSSGYSVMEIENREGYGSFIFSYAIEKIPESSDELKIKRISGSSSFDILMQLYVDDVKYTRIYNIDDASEIRALGSWSKYEYEADHGQ